MSYLKFDSNTTKRELYDFIFEVAIHDDAQDYVYEATWFHEGHQSFDTNVLQTIDIHPAENKTLAVKKVVDLFCPFDGLVVLPVKYEEDPFLALELYITRTLNQFSYGGSIVIERYTFREWYWNLGKGRK